MNSALGVPFRFCLNGQWVDLSIDPRSLLVDVIRAAGAKGARIGCLTGDCGACSVEIDGRLAKSCLVLALSAAGSDVVTIEGSHDPVTLALQAAFKTHFGFQCGYCTSGMLLVAATLLRENPAPTQADIRRAISGNLCRCTGYDSIVSAIAHAADALLQTQNNKKSNGGKHDE